MSGITKRLMLITAIALFAVLPAKVQAVDVGKFNPERIIDDSVFTNSNAMSVKQIQDFLNSKVPVCDTNGNKFHNGVLRKNYSASNPAPFTCLKDFYQNTSTGESNYGGAPIPAGAKSAARIIWDASQEHRINPQVLIVTLQKEVSLITDDWPWSGQYERAMGYGCPDSGPNFSANCNSEYYGFYNQVNLAAAQFRRYLDFPYNYNYAVGPRYVQYNPNPDCGGSNLTIRTAATAALYNYTPYQPNQGALDNYPGTATCGAYGNRNFWYKYNEWFGSTIGIMSDISLSGDWDGDGDDSLGLQRGDTFFIDNNNDGKTDESFVYGRWGDQAVAGDWNGDGVDTIGVKRGNVYYLDIDGDFVSDQTLVLGEENDIPVSGDWNGDGMDTIGVRRLSWYHLDFENDGTFDYSVNFGRATDFPVVANRDGSNRDHLGVQRNSTFYFDTDYNGTSDDTFTEDSKDKAEFGDWSGDGVDTIATRKGAFYDLQLLEEITPEKIENGFGRVTDEELTGDWNGDGVDTPAIKRGRKFYLDNTNNSQPDIVFEFGRPTDQAVAGDWNGDGVDTISVKRGDFYFIDLDGDQIADDRLLFGRPTDQAVAGDWNGDGVDTISVKRGDFYFIDLDGDQIADDRLLFGRPTDQAVAGDWNGDGVDTLGLRRNDTFFLDYNNNAQVDKSYKYGSGQESLIAGKWSVSAVNDNVGLRDGYWFDLHLTEGRNKSVLPVRFGR